MGIDAYQLLNQEQGCFKNMFLCILTMFVFLSRTEFQCHNTHSIYILAAKFVNIK